MSIFDYGLLPTIHNRWINPSHKITITNKEFGIGQYHDTDHRMLYAMFQLLVDYVEIECAAMNSNYFTTPWQKVLDTLHTVPVLHWFLPSYRNALQGLHRLRWEMKLIHEHPSQAESARVIFDLYKFWTRTRPNRIDPYDLYRPIEISDLIHNARNNNGIITFTDTQREYFDAVQKLEDKYEAEDTEMLHLLIKYRSCLWT